VTHFTHAKTLVVGDTTFMTSRRHSFGALPNVIEGTVTKVSPSGQITAEFKGAGGTYTERFTKSGDEIGGSRYLIAPETAATLITQRQQRDHAIKVRGAVEQAHTDATALVRRSPHYDADDVAKLVASLEAALAAAKAL
jgi:hypothetical protein